VVVSTLNTPLTSLILELVWKRFLKELSMLVSITDLRFSRVPIMAGAGLGVAAVGVDDLPKPRLSRFCDLFASFSGLYCASDAFVTVVLRPTAAGAVMGEEPIGEAGGGLPSANWYESGLDITADSASSGLPCSPI